MSSLKIRVVQSTLALLIGCAVSAQAEMTLKKLKSTFENQQLAIAESTMALEEKYTAALNRLRDSYKSKGELRAVLAIEEELKAVGQAESMQNFPGLEKAQSVFLEQFDKLENDQRAQQVKLAKQYLSGLERLQIDLTRKNDIPGAKEVMAEADRIEMLAKEWSAGADHFAKGGEESIAPESIENPQPGGGNPERETYIIESDGTQGTLKMKFNHPLFSAKNYQLVELALQMKVADARASDTPERITVWSNEKEIGSQEGAEMNEEISIPLDISELTLSEGLEVEVRCGSNALILKKAEPTPTLKVKFGQ